MCRRIEKDQGLHVDQVRAALGAIAVSEPAVFWVYVDDADRWCIRREGTPGEQKFDSQRMCFDSLAVDIVRCSSYRLFLQGRDERIHEESCDWFHRPNSGT
jgi:hypothetical protein